MGTHNKTTKTQGIKMIMKKNYNVPKDQINYEDLIDNSLTYTENYNIIKEYLKKHNLIKNIYNVYMENK